MDYADDMSFSVILIGMILFFLPFLMLAPEIESSIGFELSLLQTVVFMAYGISTMVGGFLRGEAEYLEYFVDFAASAGLLLLIFGPPLGFLIPENIWNRLTIVSLFFLSVPSTAASWYTRENVYEEKRY